MTARALAVTVAVNLASAALFALAVKYSPKLRAWLGVT